MACSCMSPMLRKYLSVRWTYGQRKSVAFLVCSSLFTSLHKCSIFFKYHDPRGTQTNEICRGREAMIGDLEPSIKEWIKKQGMLCKIKPLEGDENLDQVFDRLPVEVLGHLFLLLQRRTRINW